MSKIGLKLRSDDSQEYCESALELFEKHIIDYIELYIVPNTLDKIDQWKKLQHINKNGSNIQIPFMLHAPDHTDGINLSVTEDFDKNIQAFKEVDTFKKELNSRCTIVSCGKKGYISEAIRQLKQIKPLNVLIKNNIYRMEEYNYAVGIGSIMEELEKLKKEFICGFCLDIGNAICTANMLKNSPYESLREYNLFNPIMYRINGNDISAETNTYKNLDETNLNYSIISLIIRNNAFITINSDNSKNPDLSNFKEDVRFIRRFCK